ncbi:MAG: hypothetical protein RSA01_05615 [Clostridium sp.]|uniref:hypothetical protein n=1 Tax=Clostridium sp. TaxID=1506 RepID=UPI002FCC11A4
MGCSHNIQDNEYSSLVRTLISCIVKTSKQINIYNHLSTKIDSYVLRSIIDTKKLHLKALLHIYKLVKGEEMNLSDNPSIPEYTFDDLIIEEFKLIETVKLLSTLLPYQNLIQGCYSIITDINTVTTKLIYIKSLE